MSRSIVHPAILVLAVLLVSATAAPPAGAQEVAQYMVKFVCGLAPVQPPGEEPPVKPGNYATAINIHNYTTSGVPGTKTVALHYRQGAPLPPVPAPVFFVARRLRVLEIDCLEIWQIAQVAPGTFLKGMVQIGLRVELPVVAVYTCQTNLGPGTALDPGAGMSIDVEHIEPFLLTPATPG